MTFFKLILKNRRSYSYVMVYRHIPTFRLHARFSLTKSSPAQTYRMSDEPIAMLASPGEILTEEEEVAKNYPGVIAAIDRWLVRVRDELRSAPQARDWMTESEQVRNVVLALEERGEVLDRYMTRDEVTDIMQRLQQLENSLNREAEKASNNRVDLETRVGQLTKDFQALREQAPALHKRGWVQSFAAKRARWMRDSNYRPVVKLSPGEGEALLLPRPA